MEADSNFYTRVRQKIADHEFHPKIRKSDATNLERCRRYYANHREKRLKHSAEWDRLKTQPMEEMVLQTQAGETLQNKLQQPGNRHIFKAKNVKRNQKHP